MEIICKVCSQTIFNDIMDTDELRLPEKRKIIGKHLATHDWSHFFSATIELFNHAKITPPMVPTVQEKKAT